MAVTIGVDAMGGDHAPEEIILGVAEALRELPGEDRVALFGVAERMEPIVRQAGIATDRIELIDCPQVIDMHDTPVEALRQKRNSSIVRLASAAGKGNVDAIISAGNTGAFAAACQLRIKPIPGVTRPGIAVVLPTFHGPALVCDVGANVEPKPRHLYEYARMSVLYSKHLLGVDDPKVCLVSIGEEAGKGNQLTKVAADLMKRDKYINFAGNAEGRDIFAGAGNVFITDGFVGNVILKLTEGLAEGLFKTIVREISDESAELARSFEPVVERIWKRHDFAEYGGAPLLGINSVAIICHGRSDRRAIRNAVRVAREELRVNLNAEIERFMDDGLEDSE